MLKPGLIRFINRLPVKFPTEKQLVTPAMHQNLCYQQDLGRCRNCGMPIVNLEFLAYLAIWTKTGPCTALKEVCLQCFMAI